MPALAGTIVAMLGSLNILVFPSLAGRWHYFLRLLSPQGCLPVLGVNSPQNSKTMTILQASLWVPSSEPKGQPHVLGSQSRSLLCVSRVICHPKAWLSSVQKTQI